MYWANQYVEKNAQQNYVEKTVEAKEGITEQEKKEEGEAQEGRLVQETKQHLAGQGITSSKQDKEPSYVKRKQEAWHNRGVHCSSMIQ